MAEIVDFKARAATTAQISLETQQSAVDVLYDGPEGKILRPENKFAAAKLAEGTGWLIAKAEYSEFEKSGKPLIIFVPKPREASLLTSFGNSAVLQYRQRFDAQILAEETKYDKTEKYYTGKNSGSIIGPFKRCVAPLISLPELKAVPQHDYYSPESRFSRKKLPHNLVELVLAASLKDPKKGEYLFENLPLHLQWVPEEYRTLSICLGALRRAEQHRGNPYAVFNYIPERVRQDREFQDAVIKEFNNPFIQWYRVIETAKKPRTLIHVEPGNQDMGIDNSFTLKDGIK